MLKTWKSAMTIALACSLAVWFAIPAWGAIDVSFTQIDPVNFPIIKGYILVTDETGNVLKELDTSDFTVTEQSNLEQTPTVQDPVDIELIAENQVAIAVGLVIDRSTSMEEQIADAKQAARGFISLLKDEDKSAITSFGSSVVSAQAFTHQRDLLVNAVDSISVGGSTALFDALYAALRECGKTSGIKAVVAFTDGEENASDHSLVEVLELAKNVNVPVYMIGLGTQVNTEELRNIADQTGGMYKYAPKASDLLEIYNDIGQLTRQQYLVTYTTHNPKYDGTTRTVTISITAEASTDQDSRTYFVPPSPSAPKISAVQLWSNETLIPWGTSIYAREPVHITAEISDDVDVKEATLFYRTTQSSGTYYELRMDNTSGDTYGVAIPETDINAPGVDFYIAASDGALTSTSPSNAPAFFPHQIAVLPNHFPVITHTPVTQAVVGELITIAAEVTDTDAGDNVDKALVYYRQGGRILYKSVPMENTAGNHYEATIPAGEVSDLGIDYYLMAADSHGARTYDGTCVKPHHVDVVQVSVPEDEVVHFPDPNLEQAIRDAIDKPTGDLYQSDLMGLTELHLSYREISDLTGLDHCTVLTNLNLQNCQISDLSPLAGLTKLTWLNLYWNQISDLSPLAGLTNLTWLNLALNQISDFSPLAGLTNLTKLYLFGNQISDLSPLAGLTNLTQLYLGWCWHPISDFSPLAGLTNLVVLDLRDSKISDIGFLAGLTNLTTLYLGHNPISDLSPLAGLTNLTWLNLEDNQVTSLEALVDNPGLGVDDEIRLQNNYLDVSSGSDDMQDIQKLVDRGVQVTYTPQNTVCFPDQSRVSISPESITTSIGGRAEYSITVKNPNDIPISPDLSLEGLPSAWYTLSKESLTLTAGEEEQITLGITVPESPDNAGNYEFTVVAGSTSTSAVLNVVIEPIIYGLSPLDHITLSSDSIVCSWKTSVDSSTELYIRAKDETDFTRLQGESGLEHSIMSEELPRNKDYVWHVKTCTEFGCAVSENRSFHIDNGIVFTQDEYVFNVRREYDQHFQVGVTNADDEPHNLLVKANSPYKDLFLGFVGEGSIDRQITLNPGEARTIAFVIHAQDAEHKAYTFPITLTSHDAENITDYALVHINVRWPDIDFDIREVSTDPMTLVKTYQVTNNGDSLTDFRVLLDDAIKNEVYLEPQINHYYLRAGQSIELKAIPLFSEDHCSIKGTVTAEAAGVSKTIAVSFECPEGTELFQGHIDHPLYVTEIHDWYCINNPEIDAAFSLPSGFEADDVIYAKLFIDFSLPWRRSSYAPHNVFIKVNGEDIGQLMNTIPEGRYAFSIDSSVLNYANIGKAENRIHIHTEYPTYAHFVSNTHMRVQICLEELERWVCAANQEEANASLWEIPGIEKPPSTIDVQILSPSEGSNVTVGQPTLIKASVAGDYGPILYTNVTASVSNTDLTVELKDDGIHNDGEAGDGIYANTWTPDKIESCEITVSANDCAASGSDSVIVSVKAERACARIVLEGDCVALTEETEKFTIKALNIPDPGLKGLIMNLAYDPAVIHIDEIRGVSPFSIKSSRINNEVGKVRVVATVEATTLTGNVDLFELTVSGVGNAGDHTDVTITFDEFRDSKDNELCQTIAQDMQITICSELCKLKGDVNLNGAISVVDLATLADHLLDPTQYPLTITQKACADVAKECSTLSTIDVAQLADYLLDPTDIILDCRSQASLTSYGVDCIGDWEGDGVAYSDIISARLTREGDGLVFTMNLNGEIPKAPSRYVAYNFPLDVDKDEKTGNPEFGMGTDVWVGASPSEGVWKPGIGYWKSDGTYEIIYLPDSAVSLSSNVVKIRVPSQALKEAGVDLGNLASLYWTANTYYEKDNGIWDYLPNRGHMVWPGGYHSCS